MKRFILTSGLAAVAFSAMTLSAFAGDRPAAVLAGRAEGGRGLHRLHRCLAAIDLSADQKAAIQAILAAAKTTIQADAETVRADHEKLHADLTSGADKGVVGQDALTAHADAGKLHAAADAVRDQILAKLSPTSIPLSRIVSRPRVAAPARPDSAAASKRTSTARAARRARTASFPQEELTVQSFNPSAPAFAHWPSWKLAPPERPIAPMIFPSITRGTPPSTGTAPSRPSMRRPSPPPARTS